MSRKKAKKSQWGGRRKGAGRRGRKDVGGTAKICVSVTKEILQTAVKNWHGTRSTLVDHLLRQFVESEATI